MGGPKSWTMLHDTLAESIFKELAGEKSSNGKPVTVGEIMAVWNKELEDHIGNESSHFNELQVYTREQVLNKAHGIIKKAQRAKGIKGKAKKE